MEKIEIYLEIFEQNIYIKGKKELVEELKDTIYSQLNEEQTNVDEILEKLGNPAKLAIEYSTSQKYLIGPEYFSTFNYASIITAKLTALIYAIVFIVLKVVQIFNVDLEGLGIIGKFDLTSAGGITSTFFSTFFGFIWGLIFTEIIALGIVLIIFIIMERVNLSVDGADSLQMTNWTVKDLPKKVNEKRNRLIGLIYTLIWIIFSVAVIYRLFYPVLIDNVEVVVFNSEAKIIFIISALLLFTFEIIKFLFQQKRKTLFLLKIGESVLNLIVMYILFIDKQFILIADYIGEGSNKEINTILYSLIILIIIINLIITLYNYLIKKKS